MMMIFKICYTNEIYIQIIELEINVINTNAIELNQNKYILFLAQ